MKKLFQITVILFLISFSLYIFANASALGNSTSKVFKRPELQVCKDDNGIIIAYGTKCELTLAFRTCYDNDCPTGSTGRDPTPHF